MEKEEEEEDARGGKLGHDLHQEVARREWSLRAQRGEERGSLERGGGRKQRGKESTTTSSTLHHRRRHRQKWRSQARPRPHDSFPDVFAVQSNRGELRFPQAAIGAFELLSVRICREEDEARGPWIPT